MALNQIASTSSFTQQGQVDWVQLANTSVSTSVAILSRLSAANIDPFTLAVGHALCAGFKLSTTGQARLHEALNKLVSCSSIGNMIWFGVGVKHVVRHLAQTTNGSSCIVLCAALAEVHTPEVSAMILSELAELHGAPEDLRPSPRQWHYLIDTCSGVLAGTNFSCVAEHFMSLTGRRSVLRRHYQTRASRAPGNLKDVAKTLKAMSLVSSGVLTSITIRGGPICGWIAALGYWFLGLEVKIQDSSGTVLFESHLHDMDIRLSIIYSDSEIDTSDATVVSNTYYIGQMDEIFDNKDTRHRVIAGRVHWGTALSATFGQDGKQLAELQVFGQMIGSIARIFTSISKAEPRVPLDNKELENWSGYSEMSFGRGFLDSTISWLPELNSLYPSMETYVDMAYSEAVIHLEEAISALVDVCRCRNCIPDIGDTRHFCLPVLAKAVIFLVWNLASIQLESEILPSRPGLERIYVIFSDDSRRVDSWYSNWYIGRGCSSRHKPRHRYGDLSWIRNHFNFASSYHTAQLVFAGNIQPNLSHSSLGASSEYGICVYLGILKEVSDRPDQAARWHVLAGHIETKHGRRYQYLCDLYNPRGVFPEFGEALHWDSSYWASMAFLRYEADDYIPVISLPNDIDTGSQDLKVDLKLKETVDRLLITLLFSCSKGTCEVGPHALTRLLTSKSGLIHCPHSCHQTVKHQGLRTTCQEGAQDIRLLTVAGEGKVKHLGSRSADRNIVIRLLNRNILARCLGVFVDPYAGGGVLLRQNECTSCSVDAAREMHEPVVYIIQ